MGYGEIYKETISRTKLSISIVVFFNYADIKNAIKSLNENFPKDLVITLFIVDNSPRETSEQVSFKKYIRKFEYIKYIYVGENLGFGAGHNKVISFIDSEFHCIMNPDILFIENPFDKIIDYLKKNRDIGMVIPKILDSNGEILDAYREEITIFDMFIRRFAKKIFAKRIKEKSLRNNNYNEVFNVPFAQGCFLVIRTELFKEINGFDENYFMYVEDADLCKRVNMISRVVYFPDAVVIHKWERASNKNLKLFFWHLKSAKYYFSKWGIKFI